MAGGREGADEARQGPEKSKLAQLRESGFLTRVLVLSHFRSHPHATLREIGAPLGVTMQAVSVYVQRLIQEGHLEEAADGGRKLTPRGIQWLQDSLLSARQAIDAALEPMTIIKVTSAVAASAIQTGSRVGLSLEHGVLVARPNHGSASQGRATNDAPAGGEVLVAELEGMVEITPGKIVLLRLPTPEEGGSTRMDPERTGALLNELMARAPRIGIIGVSARVTLAQAEHRPEFEFAAAHAAHHAAQLGFDILLLVSGEHFRETTTTIDQLNSSATQHVGIEVVQPPLKHIRGAASSSAGARKRRR